jgi:hypothetical protein
VETLKRKAEEGDCPITIEKAKLPKVKKAKKEKKPKTS